MEGLQKNISFESNEYQLVEVFKNFLDKKLNDYEGDRKAKIIDKLIKIVKNSELADDPDDILLGFVKEYLGPQFELEFVSGYTDTIILEYLDIQKNQFKEIDPTVLENGKSLESITNAIEISLQGSGLKLSSDLSLSEVKYLYQNISERETFFKILKFVAEIKKIDNLKNKTLKNEHLLNKMNHKRVKDEFKYTGRLTETRPINKRGQKYLGDCVEFNLNDDTHRLIFRLFDITAKVPVYDNIIYIQVLGDPDYSH